MTNDALTLSNFLLSIACHFIFVVGLMYACGKMRQKSVVRDVQKNGNKSIGKPIKFNPNRPQKSTPHSELRSLLITDSEEKAMMAKIVRCMPKSTSLDEVLTTIHRPGSLRSTQINLENLGVYLPINFLFSVRKCKLGL